MKTKDNIIKFPRNICNKIWWVVLWLLKKISLTHLLIITKVKIPGEFYKWNEKTFLPEISEPNDFQKNKYSSFYVNKT